MQLKEEQEKIKAEKEELENELEEVEEEEVSEEEETQFEDNDTATVKDSDDMSDEDYLIEENEQKSTFTLDDIQDENPSDPGQNNSGNPVFRAANGDENDHNDSNFEQTYGSASDIAAGDDIQVAEDNPPDMKLVKKQVY